MIPRLVHDTLEAFKRHLAERCGQRVLELRLFGSVARGVVHPESDVDVLVLVDRRDPRLDEAIVAAALAANDETGLYWRVSPLVRSRDDFEAMVRMERRLAMDILREGGVL